MTLGQVLRRDRVSSCSRKTPSRGDLAERLAVGRARHGDRDRARRAVARQADDAHVVAEVLAAELRADAGLLRELEHLLPRARRRGSRGRARCPSVGQRVEVARRRELRRLQRELGRRAADDDGEVVRRARRGAERAHLLVEERAAGSRVEQRLGLLEQVALVGRAAALGHEQELVGVAVGRRRSRSGPAGWCRCSSPRTCRAAPSASSAGWRRA